MSKLVRPQEALARLDAAVQQALDARAAHLEQLALEAHALRDPAANPRVLHAMAVRAALTPYVLELQRLVRGDVTLLNPVPLKVALHSERARVSLRLDPAWDALTVASLGLRRTSDLSRPWVRALVALFTEAARDLGFRRLVLADLHTPAEQQLAASCGLTPAPTREGSLLGADWELELAPEQDGHTETLAH